MIVKLVWIFALIGGLFSCIAIVVALGSSNPMNQAANACLALALAGVPYCLAKAVTAIADRSSEHLEAMNKKMLDQTRLLASIASEKRKSSIYDPA